MSLTNSDADVHSQHLTEYRDNKGGVKGKAEELKGIPIPQEEQQYQLTRPSRAPRDYTTKQSPHIKGTMAPALYFVSKKLILYQHTHSLLSTLSSPYARE